MTETIINICESCITHSIENGFVDTLLFNRTFKLVASEDCTAGYHPTCSNDGTPICSNDCANWPQTHNSNILGCACECHTS